MTADRLGTEEQMWPDKGQNPFPERHCAGKDKGAVHLYSEGKQTVLQAKGKRTRRMPDPSADVEYTAIERNYGRRVCREYVATARPTAPGKEHVHKGLAANKMTQPLAITGTEEKALRQQIQILLE